MIRIRTQAIKYFNRYTGNIETEAVYGERFLRWAYGTSSGLLSVEVLIKQIWVSRWYGWRMNRSKSRHRVPRFVSRYGVKMADFEREAHDYQSFNDFFSRKLKDGARKIDKNPKSIVFPVDGRHMGFQNISLIRGVFVKGQYFNLEKLLGDAAEADHYKDGALVLSRLCPVDYHRFHFPVGGDVGESRYIKGPLYSVNPFALRFSLGILSENKRMITPIETPNIGRVLMLEVGATFVGSLMQSFQKNSAVNRGDEKGFFRFGGSSTILLFEKGKIQLDQDLVTQSANGLELYAKMGDRMGAAL